MHALHLDPNRTATTEPTIVAMPGEREIGEAVAALVGRIDPQGSLSLPELVDRLERAHIVHTLASVGGNQSKAARILGISRRKLLYRIEQFGLPRPRKDKLR